MFEQILDQMAYDLLNAEAKKLYSQDKASGNWHFQFVPKASHKEFIENNNKLKSQLEEATKKLAAFGEFTPEKLKELQDQLAKKGDGKEGGTEQAKALADLQTKLDQATKAHASKELEQKKAFDEAQSQIYDLKLTHAITTAAASLGTVQDQALPHLVSYAKQYAKLNKEGQIEFRNGEDLLMVSIKEPSKGMDVNEFLSNYAAKEASFYFKPSSGGGAPGSGTKPNNNSSGTKLYFPKSILGNQADYERARTQAEKEGKEFALQE